MDALKMKFPFGLGLFSGALAVGNNKKEGPNPRNRKKNDDINSKKLNKFIKIN